MLYVLEFQTNGNVGSVIPTAYTDPAEAEAKYHDILTYAAKSAIEKHGAMIVTDDMFVTKHELYTHQVEQA